jgi:hypothetical protein
MTGQASDVQVIGEPYETEMLMRVSERGRWKSASKGTSLAAYSTHAGICAGVSGIDLPTSTLQYSEETFQCGCGPSLLAGLLFS